MANIFLTRKCNLKCPYCFADEFVNKQNEEITLDNFKAALNFIKTDSNERIGLIGGEPTLHPEFDKILEIIIKDEAVKNVIIFSNGLEIDKYIDYLKNEKFQVLINCNSSKDIGEQRYNKLKNNLVLLSEIMPERFSLGINIYSSDMDYTYIFDLLKLTNKHNLRFSTALPNELKEETKDIIENFKEMKNVLFSFFKDCYEKEICPSNDCNSFPDCFYTPEDKLLLIKLAQLSEKYKAANPIVTCHICSPVIDILPDMNAVRCFGLSKYMKAPINEYKTIANLRKYFYNKIDIFARTAFIREECDNCKMRLLDKCGICFTYKLKKIQQNKEFLIRC